MASGEAKQHRKRRTPDEWRALLSRFSANDVSLAEFCRREAISTESFHRWRRQLAPGDGRERFYKPGPAFIDLGTLPAATPTSVAEQSTSRFELKLDLGQGIVLHLVRG
jgi:putative transposase